MEHQEAKDQCDHRYYNPNIAALNVVEYLGKQIERDQTNKDPSGKRHYEAEPRLELEGEETAAQS